jgi:hypothetical protein
MDQPRCNAPIASYRRDTPRGRQSALGSRNTRQFQEAPKSDGDLAIERIGLRQSPVEIAGNNCLILTDELDLPGLAIVRVGRQDRMAKDIEPGVGARGLGSLPGPQRRRRAPCCDE